MEKKHRNLLYALIVLVILGLASALFLIISARCESSSLRAGLYAAVFVVTFILFVDAPHVFFRKEIRSSQNISKVLEAVLEGARADSPALDVLPDDTLKVINDATAKRRETWENLAELARMEFSAAGNLSESFAAANATFTSVDSHVLTMNTEASTLKAHVETVRDSLSKIVAGVESLDAKIASQRQAVASSVSSIEKIIDSMKKMLDVAEVDSENVQGLITSSERGREAFSVTHDEILRIGDAVARIQDIVSVIQDIAEKTTLLSLNASIEAAHAGDVGKGFAVVAEEMASLAEACSENSSAITLSISEIVEDINTMVSSSGDLETSFSQITDNVGTVTQSMHEISVNLVESSKSNETVLQIMHSLREIADGLSRDSMSVAQGSKVITSSMEELDDLSARVSDSAVAISNMVGGLKGTIAGFKGRTEELSRLASGLNGFLEDLGV